MLMAIKQHHNVKQLFLLEKDNIQTVSSLKATNLKYQIENFFGKRPLKALQ